MSVHPYVSTYMNLKTTNIHNWCLYVIDATDNNDNNNDRYVCISVIFASSSILIIALCIFSCHSSRAKKIHNQPIRLPRHKVVHVHKQKRKPTVPMAESIRFRSNHRGNQKMSGRYGIFVMSDLLAKFLEHCDAISISNCRKATIVTHTIWKPSLVEQANSYKSTHEVNSHTHSTSQENDSKPQLLEKLPLVQTATTELFGQIIICCPLNSSIPLGVRHHMTV